MIHSSLKRVKDKATRKKNAVVKFFDVTDTGYKVLRSLLDLKCQSKIRIPEMLLCKGTSHKMQMVVSSSLALF